MFPDQSLLSLHYNSWFSRHCEAKWHSSVTIYIYTSNNHGCYQSSSSQQSQQCITFCWDGHPISQAQQLIPWNRIFAIFFPLFSYFERCSFSTRTHQFKQGLKQQLKAIKLHCWQCPNVQQNSLCAQGNIYWYVLYRRYIYLLYEGCSETNRTAFIKQKQRQLKLWNSVQMYRYIWPIYHQEHFWFARVMTSLASYARPILT